MRLILLTVALAASFALAGCATPPPQTITVKVPVAVPCAIPEIPRPALPVDNLTVETDVFEVSRAAWSSIVILEAWQVKAEAAMGACR